MSEPLEITPTVEEPAALELVDQAQPDLSSNKPPPPLLRGFFSLYATPGGGLLLSIRLDGEQEDRHVPMPKNMLRAMRMFGVGDPAQMIAELTGQS